EQMDERDGRRDSQSLSGARARLMCVSTQFAGREFEIERGEAVIGRTEDNDIAVDHRSVSRHHAKIIVSGDSYRIIDMKSANGTLVNGEEYAQIELKSGDLIELGHVKFRFVPPGEQYTYQPDELAAIGGNKNGRAAVASPSLGPVSEYESPREDTNPAVGANQRHPEPQSNALLYVGLGIVVVMLAAVLVVLLTDDDKVAPPVQSEAPALEQPKLSKSVIQLLARLQEAEQNRDWEQADQLAESVLLQDPSNKDAQRIKADVDGRKAYAEAVELSKEKEWLAVLKKLQNVPEDGSVGDEAAQLRADAEDRLEVTEMVNKASLAIDEKRWDDAQKIADALEPKDPEISEALDQKIADSKRGKSTKSVPVRRIPSPKPVVKTPAAKTPKDADATGEEDPYDRAKSLIQAGQYKQALEPLGACVRNNASDCRCYRALGIAHAKLQNWEKARRNYKSYIEKCPNQKDVPKVKEMLGIE
ncbi:MAG: FHA domain-containing protein, partial [Myxococcota bacterium]